MGSPRKIARGTRVGILGNPFELAADLELGEKGRDALRSVKEILMMAVGDISAPGPWFGRVLERRRSDGAYKVAVEEMGAAVVFLPADRLLRTV